MITSQRKNQRGLSLTGLIITVSILTFFGIVGMKVFPTVLEYMAIKKALTRVISEGANSPETIRAQFNRASQVDDIKSITGKDLVIETGTRGTVVKFAYEKRIPLMEPVSLVIDYAGETVRR
jgi:Domain of unknown function (DUF4845)